MYNLIFCTTRKKNTKKIKQKVLSKSLEFVNKLFYSSECNKYEIKFLLLERQGKKSKLEAEGFFICFCFSVEEHKSIKAIIRIQKIWVTILKSIKYGKSGLPNSNNFQKYKISFLTHSSLLRWSSSALLGIPHFQSIRRKKKKKEKKKSIMEKNLKMHQI